ncbi:UPF0415 protein C7orf25 homolog [Eurytemora carolleeae]|uniref:UPF0415 protein C7orf25 homolog n=1 Tax=Eurytemora carolleeae TaxID=1294199 RepID=UPI000C75AB86|nr:UPF0415 protein C7orf25 homolog [Eurytemora carolleeae]|eukprot:XP_023324903.1 UPF0415 protein C7orf25 homolog [Eurytemora affinis]
MSDCQTPEELEELRSVLQERISLGEKLLNDLAQPSFRKVVGIAKLEKKVKQEMKFLQKFQIKDSLPELKKEHIQCSNLVHLHSIIHQLFRVKTPVSVLQPFNLYDEDGRVVKKVNVDIVCEGGFTWLKVIARNPKALELNSQGSSQYGQRSILDQVREFVLCSKQNQKMFRNPQVVFAFANGVTQSLADTVKKKGATVFGEILKSEDDLLQEDSSSGSEDDDDDDKDDEVDEIRVDEINICDNLQDTQEKIDDTKINLDITAMIAYVSSLTNGNSNFVFEEPILAQQAEWERIRPVKPFLDKVFCDHTLVCCESALKDFQTIINTLGGTSERTRAEELISRIHVVPDQESEKIKNLHISGKIKDRSRAIFGTGDNLKILTVTANSGFVRAAGGQGLNLAVIIHESRALTEGKQIRALNLKEIEELNITSQHTQETVDSS